MAHAEIEKRLLELETAALKRWCNGDPSGFFELSAQDIVYFDPFLDRRMDGRDALGKYYEGLRGQVSATRFEILNPHVHHVGDAAVLTYNFVSYGGNENKFSWNCTEVFRRRGDSWELIQSHWSFTKPGM